MAQFVATGIEIEGKVIRQFSSLSLSQGIAEHHTFRLVCPTEAIDGARGAIFHASKNLVGAAINIMIEAIGSAGALQFTGVVTQVEAARSSGHAGDVIISGFSPTVLMDDGPHCQTWEEKNIKEIAGDVLKPFPQNLLQPELNPIYGEKLAYEVQYKETGWQFLKRLSGTHGEWFFYNGSKLVLGSTTGENISLIYGNNLNSFNMAMRVKPASFQMMAYDYLNHEVYNGSPNGIADKAGLNELGKHALQKSEAFYAARPKEWHNQFLTNKKQLDDFVNTRASMQSSNMVQIQGNSNHPGVQVGATIAVGGRNIFSLVDESFGEYHVVSVRHQCDGQGNYTNDFTAIPASVKVPPEVPFAQVYCEAQSAMVTDNNDEQGLGRVRVKFHWMEGSEKSPWLRIATPHAGGGKGMFLMPEVGEEVIVGFEGDSPTKPYVIGSVYHGKAKCSFANGGNDVKALQSRSGNKVVLNDQDNSVLIEDAEGNSVVLDGSGNIKITASKNIEYTGGEEIVFTCGDSKIEMKKDGTIEIIGNKSVKVQGTTKKVEVMSDKLVKIKGTETTSIESDTKVETEAATITSTASANLGIEGKVIQINGTVSTDVKGGLLNLNC